MIVIHAGIPKTGSSAIQGWLRRNKDVLKEAGFTLLMGRPVSGPSLMELNPHTQGTANSGDVIHPLRDPMTKAAAASRFANELERLAIEHGSVVFSGESLSQPFWQHDMDVLVPLEDLARRHHVTVAYYVRPQHSALEAAWRQWGFRTGRSPSRYLVARSDHLHYFDTVTRAGVDTPSVDFVMRPFRRDLLIGGDVVKDFVRHFLSIPIEEVSGGTETNVGLALPVVNLLATVPASSLWDSAHDNRALNLLRDVLGDLDVSDPTVERGRMLLRCWAEEKFGNENRALLELMGWDVQDWIPGPYAAGSIDELDRCWGPSASQAELQVFQRLLEKVCSPTS